MTMQCCYQHPLHIQYADKNNACKAFDAGKRQTLIVDLRDQACTNPEQSTQAHTNTLLRVSFDSRRPTCIHSSMPWLHPHAFTHQCLGCIHMHSLINALVASTCIHSSMPWLHPHAFTHQCLGCIHMHSLINDDSLQIRASISYALDVLAQCLFLHTPFIHLPTKSIM